MPKPQHFQDILKLREIMAQKGRRITSITNRQRSHAELRQMARPRESSIPENEASAASSSTPTSNSSRHNLPNQLQSRPDLEDFNSKIIGIVPERYMDESDNSPEKNSGFRKSKSVDIESKEPKAWADEGLTRQDIARPYLSMASSSAGPSKRPL